MLRKWPRHWLLLPLLLASVILAGCDITPLTGSDPAQYQAYEGYQGKHATLPPIPLGVIPLNCYRWGPNTWYWPDQLPSADYGPVHIQALVCGQTGVDGNGYPVYQYAALYWNTANPGYYSIAYHPLHVSLCDHSVMLGEEGGQVSDLVRLFVFHHLGASDPKNPFKGDLSAGLSDNSMPYNEVAPTLLVRSVVDIAFGNTNCNSNPNSFTPDPSDPFAAMVWAHGAPAIPRSWIPGGCSVNGQEILIGSAGQTHSIRLAYAYYSLADPAVYVQILKCQRNNIRFLYVDANYHETTGVIAPSCDHRGDSGPGNIYYTASVGLHDPLHKEQQGGGLTATAQQVDNYLTPVAIVFHTWPINKRCDVPG